MSVAILDITDPVLQRLLRSWRRILQFISRFIGYIVASDDFIMLWPAVTDSNHGLVFISSNIFAVVLLVKKPTYHSYNLQQPVFKTV